MPVWLEESTLELSPPRGGATTSEEIKGINSRLESDSTQSDGLIEGESGRIKQEKQTSESKFQELNNKNENTKKVSRARRDSGAAMQQESYKLSTNQWKQNKGLETQKANLEGQLNSSLKKLKQQMQEKVTQAHAEVKKVVDQENQNLQEALSKLQTSNQELITRVKACIENLPYEIFIEKKEDSKCSPSAAKQEKKKN